MALFNTSKSDIELIKPKDIALEKDLQSLVESSLKTIFNCRFVATEFSTGHEHAGRIDTLALSEDNNPVIIEYKKVESSELVNQSLYYLAWLRDHKGDFQVAAHKALGDVAIDWTDIRVICIAPGYKKYDLYAVQTMGANIELWEYKFYENGLLHLEEIFRKSNVSIGGGKSTIGQKAAETKANANYKFEDHLKKASPPVQELVQAINDYTLNIDASVEQSPKKVYVAYRTSQNFLSMEVQKNKVLLFLKIKPSLLKPMPGKGRDVSNIGHFGTGNFEYTVSSAEDLEEAEELIKVSFLGVGGG